MAAPAAAAPAAVYVAGAGLVAGAIWLMTPAGKRASETLGEAIYDGGAQAVDNIRDLISGDEETSAPPVTQTQTQTDTQTQERRCDGPHAGRFQAQGYRRSQEPRRVELSEPWMRECQAPLRAEGRGMVSALLAATAAVSYQGAGLRGPAFSKMSQHVNAAPPSGFFAGHRAGWGITAAGTVVRNTSAGRDAPRVDLEVIRGRAFGDS
jgi:hypothetical protein